MRAPTGRPGLPTRVASCAGRVLFVWAVAIALENVVVGVGYRALFAGYWEMAIARQFLSPILLAAFVPAAVSMALFVEVGMHLRAAGTGRERTFHAASAFLFGAAFALSVSTGRHTESWAVRVPFMLVTGSSCGAFVWALVPKLGRLSSGRRAGAFVVLACAFWLADSFVFPRLYPGFHGACLALLLVACAFVAAELPRVFDRVGLGTLVVATGLGFFAPSAARRASRSDNLRIVLLEKAPLLGRSVRVAAMLVPPESLEDAPKTQAVAEVPRALDWAGTDVVLVTVDALRADHVSSYGYARPTTPAIDALAARGTRFAHAYCATPHTSYSVTSMLTGKYMKPLLALGVGEGSETFPMHLQRYGYRTAAFYPPAVFFIDEARFTSFRDTGLGFEYRKVEFAERTLRVEQIRRYLQNAPKDRPLFLWVHLFEPHEPYVMHAKHTFGTGARPTDVDAYDSEVAEADETVGDIVRAMDEHRSGATFVVTADHGEEFGEHGGRYHGTTVYEEQVRVPLVVVGKNVKVQTAEAPVQTIDILPTALSALGIPRPARVRGRDLGKVLRDGETTDAERRGFAFAETDDYTLVAEGHDRLVCARKVGACSLYDADADPKQSKDLGSVLPPERAKALRARLAETERDHGRYEGGLKLPDALRRGKQGDVDAAEDVAALFEDASSGVRREAAEVAFHLNRGVATTNGARRAFGHEDDDVTRKFLALTLVRSGAPDPAPREIVAKLFDGEDLAWKRRAALSLADGGDARGAAVLAQWLDAREGTQEALELDRAREIVALLARHRVRSAVPTLVAKLSDLRLRPYVAEALGAIGDASAREPLLAAFAIERYRPTRAKLSEALLATGAKDELFKPLARFAGAPEPLETSVLVAARAGFLVPKKGGLLPEGDAGAHFPEKLSGKVMAPRGGFRVLAETVSVGEATIVVAGARLVTHSVGTLSFAEGEGREGSVVVEVSHAGGVRGVWLVPLAEDLPPPPKEAWDGGVSERDDAGLSADAKAE